MKRFVAGLAGGLLLSGALAFAAGRPAHNVSPTRHPNLAEAQRLVDHAFASIEAAQRANEFDLGGHAKKAKELLEQANAELTQAAVTSNEEKK